MGQAAEFAAGSWIVRQPPMDRNLCRQLIREQKSARSSAEDERSWSVPDPPGPKMNTHLFGNPAIRLPSKRQWIRGFASPDCSGFALSEFWLS